MPTKHTARVEWAVYELRSAATVGADTKWVDQQMAAVLSGAKKMWSVSALMQCGQAAIIGR